ncbi:hypothetical protein ABIB29_002555, partial [Arthrobacter sp. UYEF36]
TIQLPPRDTKQSDKLQAKEEEDIKHGRQLRERSNGAANEKRPKQHDPGTPSGGASKMDRS